MKIIFTFLGFIAAFACFAQSPDWRSAMNDPSANYYDIRQTVRTYFENNPNADTGEGGGQMQYLRWETFWQNTEEHELYLYQQDERNDAQDEKIEKLEKENKELKQQMTQQQQQMNELKKEIEKLKKK